MIIVIMNVYCIVTVTRIVCDKYGIIIFVF